MNLVPSLFESVYLPPPKKEKTYVVETNKPATDEQVAKLAQGVVITTTTQRDGGRDRTITAPTRPCRVIRLPGSGSGASSSSSSSSSSPSSTTKRLQFTLTEGRNRQIRLMVEAIGLKVETLHRVGFCGISLKGLAKNNWAELNEQEMGIVSAALGRAGVGGGAGASFSLEEEEE